VEGKVFVVWLMCVVKLKQKGWGAESSVHKTAAHWCNSAIVALPASPPFQLQEFEIFHKTTMSTETSTSDNAEIYRQLEEYLWDTDKEFQVNWLRLSHSFAISLGNIRANIGNISLRAYRS
jgi:hypothetical protein